MRLDVAVAGRGLARSRSQARALIDAGRVRVAGRVVTRPALEVDELSVIDVAEDAWVSRAAHKLVGALDEWGVAVPPRVLDAGASTGGFTQVLLARGANRVYAFDVGHDQLAPILRQDPRVVVREGLNLRDLVLADVEGRPVDLVVADVSFISLTLLVAPLLAVVAHDGAALLMVKPQFEVGRGALGSGGVVRDEDARVAAVEAVVDAASRLGWECVWRAPSVLPGPSGNREYFVALRRQGPPV